MRKPQESKRGGSGRGQGRKPVAEGQPTVTVSLRMTAEQRDKLARLGGAEWVRQRIDKAKSHDAKNEGLAGALSASPARLEGQMLTIAILINGQPIMARSAVNTGKVLGDGCVVYAVDDGSKIHHRPENGAVKLAEKLLKTIKEQQASNA